MKIWSKASIKGDNIIIYLFCKNDSLRDKVQSLVDSSQYQVQSVDVFKPKKVQFHHEMKQNGDDDEKSTEKTENEK